MFLPGSVVLTSFTSSYRLYEFLGNLQHVAEEHNFFEPSFTPSDLGKLPQLYKEIIEDPVAVHDVFVRAQGKTMSLYNNYWQIKWRFSSQNTCCSRKKNFCASVRSR